MTDMFHSPSAGALFRPGSRFDGWSLSWVPDGALPSDARPVAPVAALGLLYRGPHPVRRVPLGVVGPREASNAERDTAARLGAHLGGLRVPVLCGGRSGVMEALCRACLEAGGEPMALLPDNEWTAANDGVAVPLATGLGSARNALIPRASVALVAIGGGYGTLSEIAFALHFGRPVFGLESPPSADGIVLCASVEDALDRVAGVILRLS